MAAEAASAPETPENPPETGETDQQLPGTPGNRAGQQFQPGQTGNKGGRPKGLAKQVRERYGDSLIGYAGAVISGYVPYDHPVDKDENGRPVRVWEKVTVAERNAIYKDLMDRGYGKAPQFAPIEDDDPLDHGVSDAQLADDFDAAMDELAAKRRKNAADAAAAAS